MVTIYMESSNGNAKDKGFFVWARKSLYCLNVMNIYDGFYLIFLPINMPVFFFVQIECAFYSLLRSSDAR